MKLVTFEDSTRRGAKRIGAIAGDSIIDLNAALACHLGDQANAGRDSEMANAAIPSDMVDFLSGGSASMDSAKQALENFSKYTKGLDGHPIAHPIAETRLLAPLPRPASIRDTISFEGHMRAFERRTGKKTPDLWYDRPIYYKGNPASVVGPEAEIEWPGYAELLDYELEFGIIIGKTGRDIAESGARSHIAGYLIFNDFSARDVIPGEVSANLGPSKGKDFDTGNAMGPWLVTPDEIDPSNLAMTARINGEVWSEGNSSDMYWTFAQMIAFISKNETLYPGDFIGSGTVENGCGDEMDKWLSHGDVVELEVEGLGLLRNTIVRP